MSAHPVHIRVALFAGITLLAGGPAAALELQMLGGAPEYFRTGDAYSSDEQRSKAERQFAEDSHQPHLPPASAFAGGFKRFPGGVGFAPQMDFFPGDSGGFTPAVYRGGPSAPPADEPEVQETLADLPPLLDTDPQDDTPVTFDEPSPPIPTTDSAPAPVPLPPALPLFATVLAGMFVLPSRRRS